ncbi:Ecdysone-induced protein 78C like protein [Argiope bruennichi]|uniref:Ecdysone-induced protein 78C like protein n=1 Tax=Argiope bruennichi TaxID=94029 RepID=A0A8T0E4M4_ARGBR|nr:Ecdysone-induced protein 78C like protein [Argiope bruennichi]
MKRNSVLLEMDAFSELETCSPVTSTVTDLRVTREDVLGFDLLELIHTEGFLPSDPSTFSRFPRPQRTRGTDPPPRSKAARIRTIATSSRCAASAETRPLDTTMASPPAKAARSWITNNSRNKPSEGRAPGKVPIHFTASSRLSGADSAFVRRTGFFHAAPKKKRVQCPARKRSPVDPTKKQKGVPVLRGPGNFPASRHSKDSVRYGRIPKCSREKREVEPTKMYDMIASVTQAHLTHCAYTQAKTQGLLKKPAVFPGISDQQSVGVQKVVAWQQFASLLSPAIPQVVEFAKRIPSFQELLQDDQLLCIKLGFFEVWLVHAARLSEEAGLTFADGTCVSRQHLELMFDREFVALIFQT